MEIFKDSSINLSSFSCITCEYSLIFSLIIKSIFSLVLKSLSSSIILSKIFSLLSSQRTILSLVYFVFTVCDTSNIYPVISSSWLNTGIPTSYFLINLFALLFQKLKSAQAVEVSLKVAIDI
ncbi:hypothetical protein [Fusobacterium polymorphum]|uniref:hypothetical protein n=1 Tax=Fusobacterium nucleatum subsp. polymorphum TaxID=76857 RepID=UPI003B985DFC